jgi:hypothetical protein
MRPSALGPGVQRMDAQSARVQRPEVQRPGVQRSPASPEREAFTSVVFRKIKDDDENHHVF